MQCRYPKKWLTLAGGLIFFIFFGCLSLTSITSPYYMSYLQLRVNSEFARYPNTIYVLSTQLCMCAISAVTLGIIMNRFKIKIKYPAALGTLLVRFLFKIILNQ